MPRAIVTLGMHRSGTSALSGAIGALGASLGSDETVSRRAESIPIQQCNQAILLALGGKWSAPIGFDAGWTERPEIRALDDRARVALDAFAASDVFTWKDPRNCFTLPFWCRFLDHDPIVAIIYRHPTEVAASLERRNRFSPVLGLALWEAYNRALLRTAEGHRAIVVAYADLARDPRGTIDRVQADLRTCGVDLPGDVAAAASGIDAGRRHHVSEELPELATPQQRRLWLELTSLAGRHDTFVAPCTGEAHPLADELLAQRAARLHAERNAAELGAQLRARRPVSRRVLAALARARTRLWSPPRATRDTGRPR